MNTSTIPNCELTHQNFVTNWVLQNDTFATMMTKNVITNKHFTFQNEQLHYKV